MSHPARGPGSLVFGTSSLATAAAAAAALALWLGAPALAAGQADDDGAGVKVDGRAGVSVPLGDLSDDTDAGFVPGVGIAFLLSDNVALRADLDVSMLSEVDEEDVEEGAQDFFAADVNLWQYSGGFEVNLAGPDSDVFFLLGLGAGATTIDPEEPDAPQPPDADDFGSETRFTLNGGVTLGVEPAEAFGVFVRARPHAIFVDPDEPEDGDLEDTLDDIWWNVPIQLGVHVAVR